MLHTKEKCCKKHPSKLLRRLQEEMRNAPKFYRHRKGSGGLRRWNNIWKSLEVGKYWNMVQRPLFSFSHCNLIGRGNMAALEGKHWANQPAGHPIALSGTFAAKTGTESQVVCFLQHYVDWSPDATFTWWTHSRNTFGLQQWQKACLKMADLVLVK